jgi:hypothetical protein
VGQCHDSVKIWKTMKKRRPHGLLSPAIATLVLQKFGSALRTVVIAPLGYQDLQLFDFERNLSRSPDTRAELSSDEPIFKNHRTRAYEWHRALVARQDRAKCEYCLRQVLKKSTQPSKSYLGPSQSSITVQELEEICCWGSNWKSCSLD